MLAIFPTWTAASGAGKTRNGVLVIYVLDPARRAVDTRSHCEVEGPCFLATITSIQTGKRDRAAMINCAYELQHYLHCAENVIIEGVQMLCPPTVNGVDVWSLEDLIQVVFFQGVETSDTAVVYRTLQSTYKLGDLDLRRKKTRRVWYSKQCLSSHTPQISDRVLHLSGQQLYAPLYVKPKRQPCEGINAV